MRLHYKGKFDGNVNKLPSGELEKHEDAIKFKEIDDVKKRLNTKFNLCIISPQCILFLN